MQYKELMIVAGAILLYILSHFFRSLRLRFIIEEQSFDTKAASIVQFGASGFGNFLPPFFKDFLFLFFYRIFFSANYVKIIVTIIYFRFFDFLITTPALLLSLIKGQEDSQELGMLMISFLFVLFILILALKQICSTLINYLIRFSHNDLSLFIIKFLAHLKNNYSLMNLASFDKILTVLLMTIAAWLSELCAIACLLKMNFLAAYKFVLANISTALPMASQGMVDLYKPLYVALVLSAVFLYFLFGHNRLNRR